MNDDNTIRGEKVGFMEIDEDDPLAGAYLGAVDEDGDDIRGPSAEGPGRYVLVREDDDD